MKVVPMELRDANAFVAKLHRHHKPVQGHRFSIGAEKNGRIVGVAIVGRPVARATDPRRVLEVTRLCTDGTKNACSFLYSAAYRIGRELGYHCIQTFILESESGTSLEASGWTLVGVSRGGSWSRTDRPRVDKAPTEPKKRYEKRMK